MTNNGKPDTNPISDNTDSFFSRVLSNESAQKGLAAAGAGVLIAVITEVIWPSS